MMKNTSKRTKTTIPNLDLKPSAGPDGAAITPPAYGLESLDVASTQNRPLQMKVGLSAGGGKSSPQNRTGLPDALKTGVESLSGLSLDDVWVHYNSSKPAQLQALAYTQGSEIHVAPGQEHHIPHEAWHVVQQKQGRVKPTGSISGMALNDNWALEGEADRMGVQALQMYPKAEKSKENGSGVVANEEDGGAGRFHAFEDKDNSIVHIADRAVTEALQMKIEKCVSRDVFNSIGSEPSEGKLQPRILQLKPIRVDTSLLKAEPEKIEVKDVGMMKNNLLGMTVTNEIKGDEEGLDNFEVAELIKEVTKDDAFKNVKGHTSSDTFLAAVTEEDEVRTDRHTVGRSEIDYDALCDVEDDTNVPDQRWVIEQGFRYKRVSENASTALSVKNSGFEITHTLRPDTDLLSWVHKVEKKPKGTTIDGYDLKAGNGTAESNETEVT